MVPRFVLRRIDRIIFAACGTSWHAALVGEYMIEECAGISVEVEYASEFRYRNPPIDPNTLVLAITQSGETADTLASLREVVSDEDRGGFLTSEVTFNATNGVAYQIAVDGLGGADCDATMKQYIDKLNRSLAMGTNLRNAGHSSRDVGIVAIAREMLYNPNWAMDAAQKMGADPEFLLVPPPYRYWLQRRAARRGTRRDRRRVH